MVGMPGLVLMLISDCAGDVNIRRNEMTRWALWREELPGDNQARDPITGDSTDT